MSSQKRPHKFRCIVPVLCFILLAAASSRSADKPTPTDTGQAWIGARIIDGTGRPALEHATLFIRNGRIEAVGAKIKPPRGVRKIDARGKTIIPGFINAHGHINDLSQLGISMDDVTDKLLVDGLASFQKSFDTLIAGLAKKTKALGRDLVASR